MKESKADENYVLGGRAPSVSFALHRCDLAQICYVAEAEGRYDGEEATEGAEPDLER